MKTNFFKKLLLAILTVTLAVPVIGGLEVKAAAKPALSNSKMTIGIGSNNYKLSVKNAKKGASYTFASGNKKVATIKKSGTVGYITGVKAGKTTITVKQKLKGKITIVGKCSLTVKASSVVADDDRTPLQLGRDILLNDPEKMSEYDAYNTFCSIQYYNPAAKYTFQSNSSNFEISEVELYGYGRYTNCEGKYTAKKPGTYTVTLKETYQKKTRTVGKFKVTVHDAVIPDSLELMKGEAAWSSEESDVFAYSGGLVVDWAEKDIVDVYNYAGYEVKAIKAGTAELKFYYPCEKDGEFGDLIGVCKVTVKDLAVKEIIAEDLTLCVGHEDLIDCDIITEPEGWGYIYTFYSNVTCKSSDEKVITFKYGNHFYSAVGEGTATVTITAGNMTKKIKVTVVSEEDYYEEGW